VTHYLSVNMAMRLGRATGTNPADLLGLSGYETGQT
jgi:hypothetical protein